MGSEATLVVRSSHRQLSLMSLLDEAVRFDARMRFQLGVPWYRWSIDCQLHGASLHCSACTAPGARLLGKIGCRAGTKTPPFAGARPGDQVDWSKEGGLDKASPPELVVTSKPRRGRPGRIVTGTHHLIHGAKAHFESGRPVEEDK